MQHPNTTPDAAAVYVWTVQMSNRTFSLVIHFPEERFSFVILLCLIFVMSCLLNGLTLVTYLRNHLLHTPNNAFIVNLAVADILQVSLSIGSSFLSLARQDWATDPTVCRCIGPLLHLSHAASVNTCLLICFHRYVSIVWPNKKLLWTMASAYRMMTAVWLMSISMVLVSIGRSSAYQFNPVLGCCSTLAVLHTDAVFATYTCILHFVLPVVAMLGLYMKTYRTVVYQRVSLAAKDMISAMDSVTKKTKYLMIAALSVFCATWLPYYVTLMTSVAHAQSVPYPAMIVVWVLQLLGTVLNPCLYAVCNRLFIRCMCRLLRCKGPLHHRHSSLVPKEVSVTSGKLPATVHRAEREVKEEIRTDEQSMAHLSDIEEEEEEELEFGNDSRSSREMSASASGSERDNTLGELPGQFGCKHSLDSHISDMSGYSSRSSVPTVLRLPMQRLNRTYSTASQQSYVACRGLSPTDSGRCSYTPGPDSGRASFNSQYYPQSATHSARNSVSSHYNMYFLSPTSTRSNTPSLANLPGSLSRHHSNSSRQSMYGHPGSRSARSSLSYSRSARSSMSYSRSARSSMSYSRSARSSMSYSRSARSSMSSRLSHYMPFPLSTRSSISEYMYDPGLNSAVDGRSSSTGNRAASPTTGELLLHSAHSDIEFLPPVEENESDRSTSKSTTIPSSADRSPDTSRSPDDDPRHRLSSVMFGDIEPEEAYDMIVEEIEERRKRHGRGRWRETFRKINPKVRKAVHFLSKISGGKLNVNPYHSDMDHAEDSTTPKLSPKGSPKDQKKSDKKEKKIEIIEEERSSELELENGILDGEMEDLGMITTMEKAVSVIVKAQRLRSRVQSIVVPFDSPIRIKEPLIKIREHSPSPMPRLESARGSCCRRGRENYKYEKRPMSHLRVPGRNPPINVPQTILEEDVAGEMIVLPETPSRRRKNASTWIAPPVIDVQDDYEMRVSSPGVLVEQHM